MTESGPLEELKLRTYREADFDALVDLWSELGMARWYNEPRRDIDHVGPVAILHGREEHRERHPERDRRQSE